MGAECYRPPRGLAWSKADDYRGGS